MKINLDTAVTMDKILQKMMDDPRFLQDFYDKKNLLEKVHSSKDKIFLISNRLRHNPHVFLKLPTTRLELPNMLKRWMNETNASNKTTK